MKVTMKKMELSLLALLFTVAPMGMTSCSDDDETKPIPEDVENPLEKEVYYITGVITSGGQVLAGAQVATNNKTTLTAANGYYSIELSTKNTYELTISKEGYLPITRSVIFTSNMNKGTAITVSQELTKESAPVLVKANEEAIVSVSEGLSIDIPANAVGADQSTSFTTYVPAPDPAVVKKEAEAIQTGVAKDIKTQTALQSIVANPSLPLNNPVVLKIAAPATDGIVFTNVKQKQLIDGQWVDKGAATYVDGSYQITVEGSITSHQVVVETDVKITPKQEELAKKTINNIGKTEIVTEKITYTEKKGWEIVSNGKAMGTVDAVLEQAAIAQMGSKPGITSTSASKDIAVSGDCSMEVVLNEQVSERTISVETNQGTKSIAVKSYNGVTPTVKVTQGSMDRQHNKK